MIIKLWSALQFEGNKPETWQNICETKEQNGGIAQLINSSEKQYIDRRHFCRSINNIWVFALTQDCLSDRPQIVCLVTLVWPWVPVTLTLTFILDHYLHILHMYLHTENGICSPRGSKVRVRLDWNRHKHIQTDSTERITTPRSWVVINETNKHPECTAYLSAVTLPRRAAAEYRWR